MYVDFDITEANLCVVALKFCVEGQRAAAEQARQADAAAHLACAECIEGLMTKVQAAMARDAALEVRASGAGA